MAWIFPGQACPWSSRVGVSLQRKAKCKNGASDNDDGESTVRRRLEPLHTYSPATAMASRVSKATRPVSLLRIDSLVLPLGSLFGTVGERRSSIAIWLCHRHWMSVRIRVVHPTIFVTHVFPQQKHLHNLTLLRRYITDISYAPYALPSHKRTHSDGNGASLKSVGRHIF